MQVLNSLWQSFFSGQAYGRAFHAGKGIGFLSLCLLAAIQTGMMFFSMQSKLHFLARDFSPGIARQIPTITFQDGKATTPEARAYEIKVPESETVIAIVDTGLPKPPEDLGGAHVFLAGESLAYGQERTERQSYQYEGWDFVLDESGINSWLDFVDRWVSAICVPFVFGFLVVWRLLQLLGFSLLTLLGCKIFGLTGTYAAKLRLTALALLPAIITGLILSAASVRLPGFVWVFTAIVIGYSVFGLYAARSFLPRPRTPSESDPSLPG